VGMADACVANIAVSTKSTKAPNVDNTIFFIASCLFILQSFVLIAHFNYRPKVYIFIK
jgi:hypothetical protein